MSRLTLFYKCGGSGRGVWGVGGHFGLEAQNFARDGNFLFDASGWFAGERASLGFAFLRLTASRI